MESIAADGSPAREAGGELALARPGEGPGEGEGEPRPPVHYSTGRLTRAQAGVVNRWRARLAEDRPLPGTDPVPFALRLLGIDDRPRASCSDAIAAAVAALLAAGPDPMALARCAEASWLAQRAAGAGRREDPAAPVYPPVSWYLPAGLADTHEELRHRAWQVAAQARAEVAAQAQQQYPGKDQEADRDLWYLRELARRGIPRRSAQVPRGVIARMAIDAWARHSPDTVCAAAVDHAAEVHQQPHRGRRDMRTLRR